MSKKNLVLSVAAFTVLASCNAFSNKTAENTAQTHAATAKSDPTVYGTLDTATFASGCFWCVEAIFESLKGVKEAVSGYAGGHTENPTYEQVGAHTTGHTETGQGD